MSENHNGKENPRVFISYSWDSPEHRLWVESFAQELRKSGIDARLDAWRDESQSIDDFMMVELERADYILAICTPQFKQKIVENAEGKATASGFEIGTAAALRRMGGKDVIPVLRAGAWTEAAPSSLLSYRFYDFSKPDVSEEFTQLRDRLLGHIRRPPELGRASGPSAAPELPDIFAQGATPEPQPTSAPAGDTPRSGPPAESPPPQPSTAPPVYRKRTVWMVVGAIFLGLVVLWNMIPDVEEPLDGTQAVAGLESNQDSPETPEPAQVDTEGNAVEPVLDPSVDWAAVLETLQEESSAENGDMVSNEGAFDDGWSLVKEKDFCEVMKELSPNSWLHVYYNSPRDVFGIATYDPRLSDIEDGKWYPLVYDLGHRGEVQLKVSARGVTGEGSNIPGMYAEHRDEAFIDDMGNFDVISVYQDIEPYQDYLILELNMDASGSAIDRLFDCIDTF